MTYRQDSQTFSRTLKHLLTVRYPGIWCIDPYRWYVDSMSCFTGFVLHAQNIKLSSGTQFGDTMHEIGPEVRDRKWAYPDRYCGKRFCWGLHSVCCNRYKIPPSMTGILVNPQFRSRAWHLHFSSVFLGLGTLPTGIGLKVRVDL